MNPVEVTGEVFTFVVFDSSGEIVGVSEPSDQGFQVKCGGNCRNCKSVVESDLCVDCYDSVISQVTIGFLLGKMGYFR